ncbi:hypothetical protein pdam_00001359 [Pocillopora damicornis]|uniref:Uncharacterized protein n=1 Tax=Pocillopora damicornis TaxID=46731 RepID=A0A3M6TKY2_POCDA|nr:hypothetical protein pdam_00001359 [Pocillopora damicornis]
MRMLSVANLENGGQAKEGNKESKAIFFRLSVRKANSRKKDKNCMILRPGSEKLFIPLLACEIKKKLWSGRREDPDMNIDLNVDLDVFMEGLGEYI